MTDLPEGWTEIVLGEFIVLQRGHDLPETQRRPGDVPVLGSFGITGSHDRAAYAGPGVSIGRSGASIGVATYTPDAYWPLNTVLFVRDFRGNDPRYAYYLLSSLDFGAFNSGSAQPSLNRNYIADIALSLPPLAEQRAIAHVLGALDDKIESNRRMASAAEGLLESLAESLDAGPDIALDLIASADRAITDPALLEDRVVDHFSIPAFDAVGLPERVAPSTIKSSKFAVTGPSVLVSRLNPATPRVWFAVPGPSHALASTEFLVLRGLDGVSLGALWLAVRSPDFLEELRRRATGTSGSHQRIKPGDAMSVAVPDVRSLPSETRDEADGLLALAHQARVESRTLAGLRDALLPELLSGRLRVPEARERVGAVM